MCVYIAVPAWNDFHLKSNVNDAAISICFFGYDNFVKTFKTVFDDAGSRGDVPVQLLECIIMINLYAIWKWTESEQQ